MKKIILFVLLLMSFNIFAHCGGCGSSDNHQDDQSSSSSTTTDGSKKHCDSADGKNCSESGKECSEEKKKSKN